MRCRSRQATDGKQSPPSLPLRLIYQTSTAWRPQRAYAMNHKTHRDAAVWFLAIRAGTGADIFTLRLCEGLNARGIRAEITWLPHRAEYLPWTAPVPKPPEWATAVHINTWLHPRFIPRHLPVVATLHHSVHDPALRPYKSPLQATYHHYWVYPIERKVLSLADRVTAVSAYTARKAEEHFETKDVRIIHNGVDTKIFMPPPKRCIHSPFRLLFVGTWTRRKGVDLLAPLMEILGFEFELHHTGDTQDGGHRGRLPENFISIGKPSVSGLVAAMQEADALIFPSRLEGFGLVAAEAMACGLPVIATRGSSLPEVVEDGVTGLLCPQDDVAAFVHAIRRLAADSKLWQEMSLNAIARVHRMFSEDSALAAYLQVYRDALDAFNGETP